MMSARRDFADTAIHGSKVEPLHAAHCQGHGSLGFESAFTLVRYRYGDTFDDIAPFFGGSLVSHLVQDYNGWNLGDIRLPKNANVCTSLHVDFTSIQTRCRDLSLAVPDKAGNVFGLAFRVLMPRSSEGRLHSIRGTWGRAFGKT